MSVEVEHHGTSAIQRVSHQFEDLEQQNESYVVGMWTFLVTEIMFFGALFLVLTIYRSVYTEDFHEAHGRLIVGLGLTNTFILLTSSLTMALAVQRAQMGKKNQTAFFLGVTVLFAFGFLGVKAVEYTTEWNEHLFPGPAFNFDYEKQQSGEIAPPSPRENTQIQATSNLPPGYQMQTITKDKKQLFFSIYFVMTGLHGFHVIIGIFILGTLFILVKFNHPSVEDYMPIEMAGLYWHFVDIVWIFLFPLIYLVGR